jgi:ribose transport system ATP-binding protein
VLVLDEPTASLPRAEVTRLMLALIRYAQNGQTILFVSHRLDEVISSADVATVLRDGKLAGSLEAPGITEPALIELIVGRPLDRLFPQMPEISGEELALEVRGLSGGPLHDISFQVRRGEVVGIAGLLGSGRSELLKMIFGAYPIKSGSVLLDGKPVRFAHIGDAMKAGVAYVPEDRGGEGVFPDLTVSENMSAALVSRYWRRWRVDHAALNADSRAAIGNFMIKARSERAELSTLSGGNQQKVILARWLQRSPRVLLLDEPTQGVDINARGEIYALVRRAVAEGTSALLVTSDFEELSHVCDRVLVLNQGEVVAELTAPDISPTRLTELTLSSRAAAAS